MTDYDKDIGVELRGTAEAGDIERGVGHMFQYTGKEFVDIGKGIGGAATSAWNSVFG